MSRLSVVAAVVGVLLLAGCGEDEGQAPLDESTMDGLASSMGSNLPSSDEPPEEETFDPAKETAKEFIQRWVLTANEMHNTGDTAAFLAMVSDSCRSCRTLADNVTQVYDADGWVKTDGWRIRSIAHDGGAQWSLRVRESPIRFIASKGAEVETIAGSDVEFNVYLARGGNKHWVLNDVVQVPS